jgi:hypothetical protein
MFQPHLVFDHGAVKPIGGSRLDRRISNWAAKYWVFDGLRDWIVSLRPYPTLLLFAVPVIVLEPIKPFSFYLGGTGHIALGVTVFAAGEVVKLVMVERLFCVCRHKLMSIPVFAWGYGKYRQACDWVNLLQAWQNMRRWSRIVQCVLRRHVRQLRASRTPRRLSVQSR